MPLERLSEVTGTNETPNEKQPETIITSKTMNRIAAMMRQGTPEVQAETAEAADIKLEGLTEEPTKDEKQATPTAAPSKTDWRKLVQGEA